MLLAFFAHGEVPGRGPYKETIEKALDYGLTAGYRSAYRAPVLPGIYDGTGKPELEDLAVKSPLPEKFLSERDKENFTRECETWIGLGLHANIVTCFYVRTLVGIPRLFAEYVDRADFDFAGRLVVIHAGLSSGDIHTDIDIGT